MSPILGTLASQFSGKPFGSFESIASTTVGSGGSATVTFNSIPSTYTHLQVRLIARGGRTDSEQQAGGLYIQLNSNFLTSQHQIRSNGSTVVNIANSGGLSDGTLVLWVPAANASSSIFGAGIIDILDYASTSKTKVLRILSGNDINNGSGVIAPSSALWNSTNAITSITFGPTDGIGTIPQYSSFALYGIKGA